MADQRRLSDKEGLVAFVRDLIDDHAKDMIVQAKYGSLFQSVLEEVVQLEANLENALNQTSLPEIGTLGTTTTSLRRGRTITRDMAHVISKAISAQYNNTQSTINTALHMLHHDSKAAFEFKSAISTGLLDAFAKESASVN